MSRSGSSLRLTYQDLLALPDDGKRHELIDGEHYVTASPVPKHQRAALRLILSLGSFAAETGCGEILPAPVDVVLSDHDVVVPDIVYFSRERLHLIGEKYLEGPPDLVIEVLSPSTKQRDRTLKRRLYERAGVREYWIFDPENASMILYRLGPDGYGPGVEFSASRDDTLTTPLLPGWSLRIAEVFG